MDPVALCQQRPTLALMAGQLQPPPFLLAGLAPSRALGLVAVHKGVSFSVSKQSRSMLLPSARALRTTQLHAGTPCIPLPDSFQESSQTWHKSGPVRGGLYGKFLSGRLSSWRPTRLGPVRGQAASGEGSSPEETAVNTESQGDTAEDSNGPSQSSLAAAPTGSTGSAAQPCASAGSAEGDPEPVKRTRRKRGSRVSAVLSLGGSGDSDGEYSSSDDEGAPTPQAPSALSVGAARVDESGSSTADTSDDEAEGSGGKEVPETLQPVTTSAALAIRDEALEEGGSEVGEVSASPGSGAAGVGAVEPGMVPFRLRRSLLDALRRARAQHTDASAVRVLDEWWEQAHRSSGSVEALLAALVEMEEDGERKMLRQLVDWIVHNRGVRLPGTPAYNLLLRAAVAAMGEAGASARSMRRVESIFQEMQTRSVPPDEETFEVLLSLYASTRQYERAAAAQRLMLSLGLTPTGDVLRALLRAHCSGGSFEAAEEVMWQLAESPSGLTVDELNVLLFALSREGRSSDLSRVILRVLEAAQGAADATAPAALESTSPAPAPQEAASSAPSVPGSPALRRRRGMPKPNTNSLRALLRCFTSVGQPGRAGEVLDLLRNNSIVPDPKLLAELVSAFGVSGSPTSAEATVLWAYGSGFISLKAEPPRDRQSLWSGGPRSATASPTTTTSAADWVPLYTSLVSAYARQHLWAEALDVIREMQRVMPSLVDERPFNVLMGEMATAGEAQRAQALLALMQPSGVAPRASTFRTLARSFCVARQPEKAEDVLLEMESRGWRVSEEAMVALLDSYARSRRLSEVERLVENLDAFGLRRTPSIATSLIACHCLLGLPRAAELAFAQAFPAGERRPTSLACAWLMAAHAVLGSEEAAAKVAELMQSLSMPVPQTELQQVLDTYLAVGRGKEARVIVKYAESMGMGLRNKDSGNRIQEPQLVTA